MQRKLLQDSSLLPRALKRLTPDEREQVTVRFKPALIALLKQIVEQKHQITVFYHEEQHFFISSFMSLDEQFIVIDAPPSVVEPKLKSNDVLHIMGYLEQIPFYFIIPFYQDIVHDRFPALKFSLPDSIVRLQRRTTFRLMVPLQASLIGTLVLGQRKIEGRIADISTGGIRITDLPVELLKDVERYQELVLVTELDGLRFKMQMSVTHINLLRLAQGRRVGEFSLRFENLPKTVENHIARFLMRHERSFNKLKEMS